MRCEAEAVGREIRWKKIGTYRKTLKKVSFLHSKRYNMVVSAYRLQHGREQQIGLREEKELSISQARVANGIRPSIRQHTVLIEIFKSTMLSVL